jgi:hypothetical protein
MREFRFQLGAETGRGLARRTRREFLGCWQLICRPVVEQNGKRLRRKVKNIANGSMDGVKSVFPALYSVSSVSSVR